MLPQEHSQYPLDHAKMLVLQLASFDGSRGPFALQPLVWRHEMHGGGGDDGGGDGGGGDGGVGGGDGDGGGGDGDGGGGCEPEDELE